MYFGVLDGFINALPRRDLLSYCGRFNEAMRTGFFEAYNFYADERDLAKAVEKWTYGMRMIRLTTNTCFYGAKIFIA